MSTIEKLKNLADFRDFKRPLKDVSKDENSGVFVTESMLQCIDFDAVAKKYVKKKNANQLNSCDALFFGDEEHLLFIEFKNGSLSGDDKARDKRGLEFKMVESLLILLDISEERFADLRGRLGFVLVFNEEIISKHDHLDLKISVKGTGSQPIFAPIRYTRSFYSKVFEMTKSEFNKIFDETGKADMYIKSKFL